MPFFVGGGTIDVHEDYRVCGDLSEWMVVVVGVGLAHDMHT